jgi:hypothetical protein
MQWKWIAACSTSDFFNKPKRSLDQMREGPKPETPVALNTIG